MIRPLLAALLASCTSSANPWILQELSNWHLEDFDCGQHSSLVDWTGLRNEAAAFNKAWRVKTPPPLQLCPKLAQKSPRQWAGEVGMVLKQPEVAADECPLGALTAAAVDMICASQCRPEHLMAGQLWGRALSVRRSQTFAQVPSSTGAAWLFGTSSWPVAQLLGKWASNCTHRLHRATKAGPACSHQPLLNFRSSLHRIADATLAYTLEGSGPVNLIFDARLDHFATAALQVLSDLAQSQSGQQHVSEFSVKKFPHCGVEVATKEVLLLYLRLLGPTVPHTDPLAQRRSEDLSILLTSLPMVKLLANGWPLFAMLAASGLTTWRSHSLYPKAQVQVSDIPNVLKLAHDLLGPDVADITTAVASRGSRDLWQQLASHELPSIQPIWRRVSDWLLQAPEDVPPVVFMTMLWGSLGNETWAARFLDRAMVVGLPRFLFISPDSNLIRDCEQVSLQHGRTDTYRRLLCVRSFSRFVRPYDVNNYAKFVLLPMLISLGINYAWLDIDIFLAQNPTSRLLELAESADVLTTDHFDETCLNHGVIFVKASDRTLHWILRYIRWMHVNPFGHDQNGWDALLAHSITNEPFVPMNLPNVSLKVLDTGFEFLTLTGWAGSTATDLQQAMLLHLTRTTPIAVWEKRSQDLQPVSTFKLFFLRPLHQTLRNTAAPSC